MPIIRSTKTGRKLVFKSESPEGSADSSFLSRSKMTGRMLYFKKAPPDIDTFIRPLYPDMNMSHLTLMSVGGNIPPSLSMLSRTLIKCPVNKTLHLWIDLSYEVGIDRTAAIYELNPSDFEITEVTWNNQPDLGVLITTKDLPPGGSYVWWTVSTGTSGAIEIRMQNEESADRYWSFGTRNNADENKRPYFT